MDKDSNRLVDKKMISDMLYGEEKYILEFAEASIKSFSEFSEHYQSCLLKRDMESLRRAGHKIKPVAQIMNLGQILDEYEHSKLMIQNQNPDSDLKESAEKIDRICKQVIDDFKHILDEIE